LATGTHHYDALVGIQKAIQNLNLDGVLGADPLPSARVYLREFFKFDAALYTLPFVMVSLVPMPELREQTDSRHNQVSYTCLVTIAAPANQGQEIIQGTLRWRQSIEETFDGEQPQEIIDAMGDTVKLRRTEWQPLDVIDLEAFAHKDLFVSAAVVLVVVWKTR